MPTFLRHLELWLTLAGLAVIALVYVLLHSRRHGLARHGVGAGPRWPVRVW